MLFAAINGAAGNLPALESVLGALEAQGVLTWVHAGNAAAGNPWPNEVIRRLRERSVPAVQGPQDRLLVRFNRKRRQLEKRADPSEFAALEAAYAATRPENLEYLRALPTTRELALEGCGVLLCHGSPCSQTRPLHEDASEERFLREREVSPAQVIVVGGPDPFVREVSGTLFVCPGRLGGRLCRAEAPYALIDTDAEPPSAQLLSAPYAAPDSL
jgi:predicted phosphodiesterase